MGNNYNEQYERSISDTDKSLWKKLLGKEINWDVSKEDDINGLDALIGESRIQFKMREKVYNDLLIEVYHTMNQTGWINKHNSNCDYLVVCWRPTELVHVYDWKKLRKLWEEQHEYWSNEYQWVSARNTHRKTKEYYGTMNLAVPFDVVKDVLVWDNSKKKKVS